MDGTYEPSANMRQLAKFIREMFESLLREGMSRDDAIAVISEMLARLARGEQP